MARATTVGTLQTGNISYGNFFYNDEFPRNEILDSGLLFTYSAGRWICANKTKYLVGQMLDNYTEIDNKKVWQTELVDYDFTKDDKSFFTIPVNSSLDNSNIQNAGCALRKFSNIEGMIVDNVISQYSNEIGMNLTAKGLYLNYIRPVTNWNYNKIALYPKIYGVYAQKVDISNHTFVGSREYIKPYLANGVDLYEFYYGNTRPAVNDKFCGYALGYEVLVQGIVSPSSFSLLEENRFNGTVMVSKKNSVDSSVETYSLNFNDRYGFSPCNIILGPFIPNNHMIEKSPVFKWKGFYETEGYNIVTTDLVQWNWSVYTSNDAIIGELYSIKAGALENYFTYTDLVKMFLQLGLPIITEPNTRNSFRNGTPLADCSEDYVLYPKIKDGRVASDDYYKGTSDIKDNSDYWKKANEDEGAMDSTPEIDRTDPDTNDYTDDVDLNSPPFTPIGKFNRYYALSNDDLTSLLNFLYTSNSGTIQAMLDGLKLNGENPMNFLIGLRMLPFNITNYITSTPAEIGFGNGVATGVIAEEIGSDSFIIDMGSCTFRKYYKNFLDYEPYTTAKLYIPFCNELTIPTSVFVGHTISVKLVVDITSGACVGCVYKDDILALYTNGVIGVEIPITGENGTEYVKQGWEALKKGLSGAAELAVGAGKIGSTSFTNGGGTSLVSSSGSYNYTKSMSSSSTNSKRFSPVEIGGGFIKGIEGAYEFNNIPTPLETNGQGSPFCSLYKPTRCYFIIQQAVPMNIDGYGEKIGYACLEKGRITDYSGLIVASNPNVQPANATYEETLELNNLLASGVWI